MFRQISQDCGRELHACTRHDGTSAHILTALDIDFASLSLAYLLTYLFTVFVCLCQYVTKCVSRASALIAGTKFDAHVNFVLRQYIAKTETVLKLLRCQWMNSDHLDHRTRLLMPSLCRLRCALPAWCWFLTTKMPAKRLKRSGYLKEHLCFFQIYALTSPVNSS